MIESFTVWLRRGSVARQIGVAVFLIFSVMITFNTYIIWQHSKEALQEATKKQVLQMNSSYFDALNTLMLVGDMDEREILREKLLQNPDVIDARVIRGASVTAQYGEGFTSEKAIDEIDRLALQGKEVIRINHQKDRRILTVALPYKTAASYRGVNCLQCHDSPVGTVNGVIRIDYSLKQTDIAIENMLWDSIIINILVMLMGIVLLIFYMNRNLTRGILEADTVAEAITKQNFDVEIPAIRKDNIGRLMFSLVRMRDALKAQFNEIQKNTEHEREEMSLKLQQQEKESNLVVAFESGIVNIVKNLNQATHNVDASATSLSNISNEMTRSTASAAAGADDVFQQVSDTSRSSQEINQAFGDINQRSQQAITISEQAMQDTTSTSERMQTLQKASDDIGSVTVTISEIAEKTNLLALNASIEAARAGEVGRGFAVVANEVKSLANQTTQATKVITQQIKEIQSECRGAITAIEGISQIIKRMNEHTHDVAQIMGQYTGTLESLTSNAEHASKGMQSVRQSVSDVSDSAQESDQISNSVTQHCHQLQEIANEQEQLVHQFISMLQGIRNNSDDAHDGDDGLF